MEKVVIDELNKKRILTPCAYKAQEGIYNRDITEKNKLWTARQLDAILKNQVYTGDLIQGKKKRISHRILLL